MKIYILGVDKVIQPRGQGLTYPRHNKDFGVEQDFLQYLPTNKSLLVSSPEEADWHYLPVYWTRWHLNHNYGADGVEELQRYVDAAIIDDARTFTVCQYDDGPLVNLGRAVQFLASRKTDQGIDIPLLCKNHRKPWFKPKKTYRASFVGRLSTHPTRQEMAAALNGRSDVFIRDGDIGTRAYVKMVLQSYLALAPRGYGGSSFRLFEAMQLGVAPLLIGDIDTRPFKRFLPWDDVSFYVGDVKKLSEVLTRTTDNELLAMGERASILYKEHLTYQKWCPYVIKELQKGVQ
jgi:hypothetical protein